MGRSILRCGETEVAALVGDTLAAWRVGLASLDSTNPNSYIYRKYVSQHSNTNILASAGFLSIGIGFSENIVHMSIRLFSSDNALFTLKTSAPLHLGIPEARPMLQSFQAKSLGQLVPLSVITVTDIFLTLVANIRSSGHLLFFEIVAIT